MVNGLLFGRECYILLFRVYQVLDAPSQFPSKFCWVTININLTTKLDEGFRKVVISYCVALRTNDSLSSKSLLVGLALQLQSLVQRTLQVCTRYVCCALNLFKALFLSDALTRDVVTGAEIELRFRNTSLWNITILDVHVALIQLGFDALCELLQVLIEQVRQSLSRVRVHCATTHLHVVTNL